MKTTINIERSIGRAALVSKPVLPIEALPSRFISSVEISALDYVGAFWLAESQNRFGLPSDPIFAVGQNFDVFATIFGSQTDCIGCLSFAPDIPADAFIYKATISVAVRTRGSSGVQTFDVFAEQAYPAADPPALSDKPETDWTQTTRTNHAGPTATGNFEIDVTQQVRDVLDNTAWIPGARMNFALSPDSTGANIGWDIEDHAFNVPAGANSPTLTVDYISAGNEEKFRIADGFRATHLVLADADLAYSDRLLFLKGDSGERGVYRAQSWSGNPSVDAAYSDHAGTLTPSLSNHTMALSASLKELPQVKWENEAGDQSHYVPSSGAGNDPVGLIYDADDLYAFDAFMASHYGPGLKCDLYDKYLLMFYGLRTGVSAPASAPIAIDVNNLTWNWPWIDSVATNKIQYKWGIGFGGTPIEVTIDHGAHASGRDLFGAMICHSGTWKMWDWYNGTEKSYGLGLTDETPTGSVPVSVAPSSRNIAESRQWNVGFSGFVFGAHEYYGVAAVVFDAIPSDADLVDGFRWMKDNWPAGNKVIAPGWGQVST